MAYVNRNIGIIYNTAVDMIKDASLKPGMVVTTLGKNAINDGYGASYKIIKNGDPSISSEQISFTGNATIHAEQISSSNRETQITAMQKSIDKINTSITSLNLNNTEVSSQLSQHDDAISCVIDASVNCEIIGVVGALNITGIKIVQLMNGQKCVVVTDIDTSYAPSTNITQALDNTTATVEVSVAGREWILPITLQLIGYKKTTFTLNEYCTVTYDASKKTVTFTVDRTLCPAVHYYM